MYIGRGSKEYLGGKRGKYKGYPPLAGGKMLQRETEG